MTKNNYFHESEGEDNQAQLWSNYPNLFNHSFFKRMKQKTPPNENKLPMSLGGGGSLHEFGLFNSILISLKKTLR